MLDALERRPIAQEERFRTALKVVRLRIAVSDGDDAAITKLAGDIGEGQGEAPILIWAPPYPSDASSAANAHARSFGLVNTLDVRASDLSGIQWVDVGFWIRPDGRTAEAELLRGSNAHAWAPTILAQIAQRRYSARGDNSSGDPGSYHIERFTRGSRYITPPGSLIRRRIKYTGFEVLDLTESATPPPT